MLAIVSTRPDRGVSITYPTPEIMAMLTHGGAPEGYFGRALDRGWEIEKFIRDESWHGSLSTASRERLAARWIDCVMFGGLTDAEAYGLIRDKDTNDDWTAKELTDDIPQDRWFRDAWVRGHNGGPIEIDLGRARSAHFRHLKETSAKADLMVPEPDWHQVRRSLLSASTIEAVRAIKGT